MEKKENQWIQPSRTAAGDDDDVKFQILAFASGGGGRFKKPFNKVTPKPGDK